MTLVAKILLFLQVVVICAALGAVLAFVGLMIFGNLAGASNMEGALAMGAAGLAPYGALAGAAIGVWISLRMMARMSRGAILLGGYGLAAIVVFAIGAYFVIEELSDGNPYEIENEPVLLVEWRLPEQIQHSMADRIFRYSLRSTFMDWSLSLGWDTPRVRDEGGVSILK